MKKSKTKAKKEPRKKFLLELGTIFTGGFYEFQKARIKAYNRVRNIIFRKATGLDLSQVQDKKKEKEYLKEYADKELQKHANKLEKQGKLTAQEKKFLDKMFTLLEDVEKKESEYKKEVEKIIMNEPIWTGFLQHIKGIGPLITAMLLYYFGYCEKAEYPSNLWSFAGLTPNSKYVKGESSGFNKNLRMYCWRISDSFIKQRTPRYRPIYDAEKARQLKLIENKAENAPTRPGHAEKRARRKMVKFFLSDLYRVCKHLTGQPQSKPFVIDKLKHHHFDDILVYLKKLKARKP